MKTLLLIALILFFLFCLVDCIMPNMHRKKEVKTFLHCLFAHRGLFTPDQRIPENSMAAFSNAVQKGYGIELNIELTKDKQVVVFHDHTLSRMCGIDLPVCEMTYEELQKITLGHTNERISLFQDVLNLVRQVPFVNRNQTALSEHAYLPACQSASHGLHRGVSVLNPLIPWHCAGTKNTASRWYEDSFLPNLTRPVQRRIFPLFSGKISAFEFFRQT